MPHESLEEFIEQKKKDVIKAKLDYTRRRQATRFLVAEGVLTSEEGAKNDKEEYTKLLAILEQIRNRKFLKEGAWNI